MNNKPVDWEALVSCGLPLSHNKTTEVRPSLQLLIESLSRALCELHECRQKQGQQDNCAHSQRVGEYEPGYDIRVNDGAVHVEYERKLDSLCALLWAIKSHYGSVFDKYFANLPGVKVLLDSEPTGRIIKLRRIALSRLAEYL